jgi:hypothetical protein
MYLPYFDRRMEVERQQQSRGDEALSGAVLRQ